VFGSEIPLNIEGTLASRNRNGLENIPALDAVVFSFYRNLLSVSLWGKQGSTHGFWNNYGRAQG
jgi:hypothetical protein